MGVEAEGITYGDGDIPGYNTRYLNKNEDSIATFSRASIYLNDKSNDDPHDGLVSTVEHELGHAIGLSTITVMIGEIQSCIQTLSCGVKIM